MRIFYATCMEQERQRANDRGKKKSHLENNGKLLTVLLKKKHTHTHHAIYTREVLWYFPMPARRSPTDSFVPSFRKMKTSERNWFVGLILLVLPLVSAFISKVRIHWKCTLPLDLHSLKA